MDRLSPIAEEPITSLGEALVAWTDAGEPDAAFARDLEEVGAADLDPEVPWD